jgi:hypothetical protein
VGFSAESTGDLRCRAAILTILDQLIAHRRAGHLTSSHMAASPSRLLKVRGAGRPLTVIRSQPGRARTFAKEELQFPLLTCER